MSGRGLVTMEVLCRADPDQWGAWVGDHPGLPGPISFRLRQTDTIVMSDEEKKAEVIRLMESAEAEAEKVEVKAQHTAEAARLMRDVAKPIAQLYRAIPADGLPPGGWDREIINLTRWHSGATAYQNLESGSFNMMSMGSVNSAYSTAAVYMIQNTQSPATKAAEKTISQALERANLADKTIASMQRLGLDRRSGNDRPALDLLIEAKSAIDRPVLGDGGPTSVLIPLRESIDAAITELVRRRPKQEPAKSWKEKVVSIGTHCGIGMPAVQIDKLGDDTSALMNELSGAKQASMTRQQIMKYFQRGLLLLNTLLDRVDGSKLRAG
jgi:hypothetical protein